MPNYYKGAYKEFNRDIERLELELMTGGIWDLRGSFEELNIYEDVFSNVTQGNIKFDETLDLQELGQLLGGERLSVKFTTHREQGIYWYEKEFWVYKLEDLTPDVEQHRKQFSLVFATPQFFYNLNSRLSISLHGDIGDMVDKIARNQLQIQNLKVEDGGKHDKDFIVPNWQPFRAINYLCETSVNNRGAANFVFYENVKEFRLTTLETLGRFGAFTKLYYDMPDHVPGNFNVGHIKELYIDKSWDQIQNARMGMLGSTMYTYDLINKRYIKRTHDYLNDFNNIGHTEDKPLIHNDYPYNSKNKLYFPSDMYYHEFSKEWTRERAWQMQQFNNFKLTVVVPGNTFKYIGDVIDVTIPSTKVGYGDKEDTVLSNNYIICKIQHHITKDHYMNTYELRRDSYDARADF